MKTITIENFRCFEKYRVEFAEKTTVLIGKNGAGKTNLLSAVVYSLSFPFAKNNMNGIQTIATSNPDLKIAEIDNKGRYDSRYDDKIDDYIYPIKLINEALFDDKVIHWAMVKEKKTGSILPTQYKEAFEKFHNYYSENSIEKPLPVLAYFSDSFPHKDANISLFAKSILKSGRAFPRNFGYYKWDEQNNCSGIWKEKYIQTYISLIGLDRVLQEKIIIINELELQLHQTHDRNKIASLKNDILGLRKEIGSFDSELKTTPEFQEISFIVGKLKKFTEPLKYDISDNFEFEVANIGVGGTPKIGLRIKLLFKSNKSSYFDDLPQGYKRLFSIVLDIAYRSYILNKKNDPTGIVIIDEVELHLHPSLQQEVLRRFRNAFPSIQFIVSTHSPLVVSNIDADGKTNKIIRLTYDGQHYQNETLDNVYGIDYITNLNEVMESGYRSTTIDKLINAYLVLFGKKRLTEASAVIEKLKDYLGGSIPDLLQKEIDNLKKSYS